LKKIFLITKLKTTNTGNEALSQEIIKLFKNTVENTIINVNGRPSGLDGYMPSLLAKSSDPIALFENWTDKIVNKIKKEPRVAFKENNWSVQLMFDETGSSLSNKKFNKIKNSLKLIKRYFNSFFIYKNQYKKRAATLREADWLIYSGAGEVTDGHSINDASVIVRQLVEIRVAQKLGLKTAAVNQSIFIKTDVIKNILTHVYNKMQHIVVRGQSSAKCLIEFGIYKELINIAPDSAINTDILPFPERNKNIVGFNITKDVKISDEEIGSIIAYLKQKNKRVVFCSNEVTGDAKIFRNIKEKFGVHSIGKHENYIEYTRQLAECDFVISTRVHTNMLALVSNTIIIPIEGTDFRLDELLTGFEYPISVLKSNETKWVDQLLREIDNVLQNKYDFEEFFTVKLPKQISKSANNSIWLNDIN